MEDLTSGEVETNNFEGMEYQNGIRVVAGGWSLFCFLYVCLYLLYFCLYFVIIVLSVFLSHCYSLYTHTHTMYTHTHTFTLTLTHRKLSISAQEIRCPECHSEAETAAGE